MCEDPSEHFRVFELLQQWRERLVSVCKNRCRLNCLSWRFTEENNGRRLSELLNYRAGETGMPKIVELRFAVGSGSDASWDSTVNWRLIFELCTWYIKIDGDSISSWEALENIGVFCCGRLPSFDSTIRLPWFYEPFLSIFSTFKSPSLCRLGSQGRILPGLLQIPLQ